MDGPFDIRGGASFVKNSLFPNMSEKNKMSSTKLKIKSLFFKALFPASYKGLQITQKLSFL